MSGLEGIAGLSLACNVMQLISFGHEAISMCRRIHESGSPEPGLSEHAESLKAVCDGLEKSLGKRPTPVATAAPTTAATRAPTMEKRLLDLAAKCIKNARDLEEEMKFLSPSQPGKLGALAAAPKILWRKRRLERLKGNLDDAQKAMDTSILERLFARAEALYQANNKGFSDLSQELQRFITDHAASNSILRNAIETQTKGIKDHVTMESSKTQNEIKSHVSLKLSSHEISIKNHVSSSAQDVQDTISQRMTSREDSKAKEQAYQQLLKSLKYPGMNERRNQVSESHPRTFRWIFSDSMHHSDSESEYSTEGNSSAYSDESVYVETSNIGPDEPSELSEGSESASYSVPHPWDSFVGWLKDDTQKTYWISGKPGSGKSTLMKYIEKNGRTMECCNSATHCISHYLWRPGTLMQQSIKGVLCSLLHQVLALGKSPAMQVLERQPNLLTKDVDTDWTMKELKKILLHLIRESTCKYVVLLDGLDEVADTPDDGPDRLLGLIGELVSTNQVKVCVSSRPEPALKRVLGKHPRLKMQNLTSRDIRLLTRERLEAMDIDLENDGADNFSKLICARAEGVFIWVILVLNSLKRGLDNYDDMDTLYSRVESLPKGLTKLYKEMWSRMKEDSDLYRRKTVLLFYMAMELKTQPRRADIWKPKANLLSLVISTDDEMLESFMVRQELPDMELLWKKWYRLGRKLPAMCAGLLDITDPEEAFSFPDNYESKFKPWGKTDINFTHRTAIDFICKSEEGRELFGPYVPKQDDLLSRAIKTDLMLRRIINRLCIPTNAAPNKIYLSLKYEGSAQSLPGLWPFQDLADISSHQTVHNLLAFTYQCLGIIALELENRITTSDSARPHHIFLANGFKDAKCADWAEETLRAATAGIEEVTLVESIALRGGCEGISASLGLGYFESFDLSGFLESNPFRLSMIQRVLRKYSYTRRRLNDIIIQPLHLACCGNVSAAWRCVLSHTLSRVLEQKRFSRFADDAIRSRWWSNIVDVIHSFLSANVLEDFKDQKYLVSIAPSSGGFSIISGRLSFQTEHGEVVFEVNDAALLAVITEAARKVLGSTSLTKLLLKPGFCLIASPKLVSNQQERSGDLVILNEILYDENMDGQRLLKQIFSGKLPILDHLMSESDGPSILRVRNIGHHREHSSALRAIGHELSAVNKDYICYDFDQARWEVGLVGLDESRFLPED